MCEFCSGTHSDAISGVGAAGGTALIDVPALEQQENARQALSRDSDLSFPYAGDANKAGGDAKNGARKVEIDFSNPAESFKAKYGVQIREENGQRQFFYHADGKEHVVLKTAADAASLKQAPAQLDKIVADRMKEIEKTYKVRFARAGEEVTRTRFRDKDCKVVNGEMVYAVQPKLPALHGLAIGIRQSQPGQLASNGREGLKIYFHDKQYLPNMYGDKPVLGAYVTEDKDGKPAFYVTPAGQEVAPTAKETEPGKRNMAWIVAHELTHNSQYNLIDLSVPDGVKKEMGWESTTERLWGIFALNERHRLQGKNGEYYGHGADSCKDTTTWFLSDKEGYALDKEGKRVAKIRDAQHFTNEEMMERSKIRPISYYFMNPTEMHAEAVTAFRMGRGERADLFKKSPELYKVAREFDQRELDSFYGVEFWSRASRKVRNPDGLVVDRTPTSLMEIDLYERSLLNKKAVNH